MSQRSLRDQAYHSIYAQIVAGTLAHGTVTSEVQLGSQLDMSRTPVRAALQRLETEGFVRIIPKHGVLVLDASARRTGDLLELIAAMLLFAVIGARRLDPESLSGLSMELGAELQARLDAGSLGDGPEGLGSFELAALSRIIALGHNREMDDTLTRTAARLLWTTAARRWAAPHRGEMAAVMRSLLDGLPEPIEAFQDALLRYLHILKKTWA
ncbi:GntR family transcriptional regulator [Paenibacillus glycinis]|uniref:GntR family transcriptional regulator n=1 Tax=Paenibacillus glycinis TaxID=2697035 RepID=A0ABW9XMZ2_9BACL|nr:GntR family transcriptional regulator [Paenibacillus glycinis]NBD24007.1 GntR family transcriptional regulator [Paenibacillus glycinis]